MECNHLFLFGALILGLISGQASAARTIPRRSTLLGAYEPITNPTDPYVVSIAQFAVSEHDYETSDDLAFLYVVSGEWQEVDGINYKLVIAISEGDGTENNYLAEVYVNLARNYQNLTSFQRLD